MYSSLFKIWNANKVVGFTTATTADAAIEKYVSLGGKCRDVTAEQISFGTPAEHINEVYQ